jgi:hypothetical protein
MGRDATITRGKSHDNHEIALSHSKRRPEETRTLADIRRTASITCDIQLKVKEAASSRYYHFPVVKYIPVSSIYAIPRTRRIFAAPKEQSGIQFISKTAIHQIILTQSETRFLFSGS